MFEYIDPESEAIVVTPGLTNAEIIIKLVELNGRRWAERNTFEDLVKELEERNDSLVSQYDQKYEEVQELESKLDDINSTVADLERDIRDLETTVSELESELDRYSDFLTHHGLDLERMTLHDALLLEKTLQDLLPEFRQ